MNRRDLDVRGFRLGASFQVHVLISPWVSFGALGAGPHVAGKDMCNITLLTPRKHVHRCVPCWHDLVPAQDTLNLDGSTDGGCQTVDPIDQEDKYGRCPTTDTVAWQKAPSISPSSGMPWAGPLFGLRPRQIAAASLSHRHRCRCKCLA